MMRFKNYLAKIKFDEEAEIFHGEVINLKDVITFQGDSVKALHKEFKASIADYLDFCEERGEGPEKPFSGSFPLRANPADHSRFFVAAKRQNKSLNAWAVDQLRKAA